MKRLASEPGSIYKVKCQKGWFSQNNCPKRLNQKIMYQYMPFSRTVCVVSESIHTDHMEGHNLKFQGERCVFCFCLFFVVVVVVFCCCCCCFLFGGEGGGACMHTKKKFHGGSMNIFWNAHFVTFTQKPINPLSPNSDLNLISPHNITH